MQRLLFETSWNKALSSIDRMMIEEVFNSTKSPVNKTVQFTPIWEAENYKRELLITVVIHNFTETDLQFSGAKLRYEDVHKQFAEHIFTLPNVTIPSKVSMPWTFIFPADSRKRIVKPINGKLTFA